MRKQKVLVIHQDKETKEAIHQVLSNFDFELMYASDGLEGLAAAKYDCPELILTDTALPVLDGFSLSEMLRNDCCTKDIPLIILNDTMNYEFLCKARSLHAKAFLMKPYLDSSLIYAVKRVLGDRIAKSKQSLPYSKVVQLNKPVLSRA